MLRGSNRRSGIGWEATANHANRANEGRGYLDPSVATPNYARSPVAKPLSFRIVRMVRGSSRFPSVRSVSLRGCIVLFSMTITTDDGRRSGKGPVFLSVFWPVTRLQPPFSASMSLGLESQRDSVSKPRVVPPPRGYPGASTFSSSNPNGVAAHSSTSWFTYRGSPCHETGLAAVLRRQRGDDATGAPSLPPGLASRWKAPAPGLPSCP